MTRFSLSLTPWAGTRQSSLSSMSGEFFSDQTLRTAVEKMENDWFFESFEPDYEVDCD